MYYVTLRQSVVSSQTWLAVTLRDNLVRAIDEAAWVPRGRGTRNLSLTMVKKFVNKIVNN